MRRANIVLGLMGPLLAASDAARGQVTPKLEFEVATVRRVEIPDINGRVPVFPPTGGVGTSDPQRVTYHGTWLMSLIAEAFGVREDQIIGLGPARKERYDIVANVPAGATKEQFNVMLGNLLRDRFHLRFHMDSKVLPVYVLRVGKNGPKFKETAVGHNYDGKARPGATDAQGFPILPPNYHGMIGLPHPGEMFMTAQDVSMADLARSLEPPGQRPIIDETGLTGHYDFKLHFEWLRRPGDPGVASDPAPSVFTAVEEQLGFKARTREQAPPPAHHRLDRPRANRELKAADEAELAAFDKGRITPDADIW